MLFEIFLVFLKLGAFTIGGGIAMIPVLQRAMVEDKKWFTEDEMVDIIAICQGLPGVIAVNMATYVGFKKRGFLGSLVATCGVILPSFVTILIIAKCLSGIGGYPAVLGAMAGLRAAAAGLVAVSVWTVGRKVITGWWTAAAAVLSLVLVVLFKVNIAVVVLAYLILGVVIGLREEGGGDDIQ